MEPVTLAEAKSHLRLEDTATEDIQVFNLITAAREYCENYTGRSFTEENTPQSVKQAMLLLIGHWYENREATGKMTESIAFSVRTILDQYRHRWWD